MAVVATVSEVVRNPEAFGASAEEVSAGLQRHMRLLDRFFAWLPEHAKRSGTAGTQPARPRQSGTGALRLVLGSRLRTGKDTVLGDRIRGRVLVEFRGSCKSASMRRCARNFTRSTRPN